MRSLKAVALIILASSCSAVLEATYFLIDSWWSQYFKLKFLYFSNVESSDFWVCIRELWILSWKEIAYSSSATVSPVCRRSYLMQWYSFSNKYSLRIALSNKDWTMEKLELVLPSAEGRLPDAAYRAQLWRATTSRLLADGRSGSYCACAQLPDAASRRQGALCRRREAGRPGPLSPRPQHAVPLRRAAHSPCGAPPSLPSPSSHCRTSLAASPSAPWRTTTNPTSRPCRPWRTRPTGCASAPSRPRPRPARGEWGWRLPPGSSPLSFLQLFCAPLAEPERAGGSPPGRREGWGGAGRGRGWHSAEDPVQRRPRPRPRVPRYRSGAAWWCSGGKWRPRARRGVVWGSCGSRHSSAPPGGGCRGTRRSPVPAGVVTAGSGRECRVDAGLKPKEFMPEAQAVSFSFRARQLELILHRISSEPKWDYLWNACSLGRAVYSGLWTGFSRGSDVCRFQGYPSFDRALPMEKNLRKQSTLTHVKLKPFFLLE